MSLLVALVLATEEVDPVDQASGGTVLAVGFVIVGIIGVIIAARLAKKRREEQEW
ncbi:MAG: hypothetical protein R8F63_17845 [Acidimicrobiales bacterium]|nr:hypothetical protein [Acidimicrobiales bacterium]